MESGLDARRGQGRGERTLSGRSSSNLFGVKSKGACVIRLFTCEWFLQAKFLANKMTAKRNETKRNDETSELNISKRSKSGSSAERRRRDWSERVASAGYASSRRATAAQQEAQFIGSWLLWIGGAAELSPALSVYHFIKCVPA